MIAVRRVPLDAIVVGPPKVPFVPHFAVPAVRPPSVVTPTMTNSYCAPLNPSGLLLSKFVARNVNRAFVT